MPTISAGDLALLRQQHRAKFYLTPHPAVVLWSAQVAGSHARESVSIAFDGGTGANFNAITAGMELWIGTSAGTYNVDRLRIKSVSSGDSGATGTVTVSLNSVVWADNQHITFIGWFLIKPRKPDIGDDGTFYKDGGASTGGITYSDQNGEPTPVCIAGENRADFLDPDTGEWEIESQLPSSYAIAQGASISSYGASLVYGPDTPVISINSGTGVGTITFDTAGLYWIAWSCTDSNGKSQVTYRWYYAHSTNPQSVHYPFTRFSINNVQGQWNNGGWSAGINVHGNADLDTIPDHSPCIVWSENWYGVTKKNITFLPDQSGTVINGYIRRDKFGQDIEKGVHTADFSITTIQGAGDNKYNFSVSLEAAQTVDTWWKYPSWITPTRAVHHFFKWHSTLLEVADVIGLNANTDGDSHVEFPDGSLFERADGALAVIRARLVCDAGGRVHFVEDVQLRPDSERSGLAQVQEIDDLDKNGPVDFVRQFEKRVPFVYLAAFDYDGGFDAEGKPQVEARCAIAPGNNPYDDGPQPATEGKQIITSQDHANEVVGRFLHAANNEYPEIPIPMMGRLGVLPIHLSEFWELTTLAGDTARRITKTLNLILRNVTATINVQQGTVACTATFEAEANGPPGIAIACPSYPDLPDTDFEIPDAENDLGGALMTGSSIQYLPPQSKSWEERSAEAVQDAYADPHWQVKQSSIASKDAIIWRCGTGYIKRSTDAGLNWADVTPGSLPAGIVFIRGEGNYVVDEEHVFLGTWEDTGTWFSRLYITSDDGASWAEQDVGASGAATDINLLDSAGQGITAASTRSHVAMSNSRYLVQGIGDGGGYSILFGIDTETETITILDSLSAAGGGGANDLPFIGRLCRLTDTHAVTVYHNNISGANDLRVRVVDITGDTISHGAEFTIHAAIPAGALHWDVARQADNAAMVVYSNQTTTYAEPIGIDDSDNTAFSAGSGASVTRDCRSFAIKEIGTAIFGAFRNHIFCSYRSSAAKLEYFIVEDMSGTVTIGSSIQLDSDNMRTSPASLVTPQATWHDIAAIGANENIMVRFYASSDNTERVIVVDLTDVDNPVEGTPQGTGYSGLYRSCIRRANNTIAFSDITSPNFNEDFATAVIAGTVVTFDANTVAIPNFVDGAPVAYIGSGYYIFTGIVTGSGHTVGAALAQEVTTSGGELKGLGMSIGKGLGEIVYVTGWDGTGLVLLIYTLPDLVLVDNIYLGDATEAEVDAKTWVAYPYAPFGDDGACYVYGRLNDPLGTGTAHIILTEDEALSFIEVEQGWGANHCGSLLEDYGRIMAIRNFASASKLYVADVGNPLKIASTLPFSAQVNPQAMQFSWLDGALFIGSGATDDVMVVVSPEPAFTRYFDLTFDHPTANGIRSIIVL